VQRPRLVHPRGPATHAINLGARHYRRAPQATQRQGGADPSEQTTITCELAGTTTVAAGVGDAGRLLLMQPANANANIKPPTIIFMTGPRVKSGVVVRSARKRRSRSSSTLGEVLGTDCGTILVSLPCRRNQRTRGPAVGSRLRLKADRKPPFCGTVAYAGNAERLVMQCSPGAEPA
jgi:hypothetical protein